MTHPEEVLAIHEQNYGHSVSFCEMEGGRILMYGGGEFLTSTDGGITWSEPFKGSYANGEPVKHAESLVKLDGKAVGLAFRQTGVSGYDSEMHFTYSEDGGESWSDPVLMNHGRLRAHAYQDTFLRTGSGRIMLPVYFGIGQGMWHQEGAPFPGGYVNGNFVSTDAHFFDPHFGASYILYSDDEGKSWDRSEGELFILLEPGGPFYPTFEPSVCEVKAGKLLMIMRTNMGRLFQAWSDDNGKTWSRAVPTLLAGSHAPGQIRKFSKTGHLLCVWTQHSEKEIKQGYVRSRLSSAVSRNGGGIWEHFQNVESIHEETFVEAGPIDLIRPGALFHGYLGPETGRNPDEATQFPENYGRWSYPSVLVTGDRVLISHTYSGHDSKTGWVTQQGCNKLKVLPASWFYGGQDPATENPWLAKIDSCPRP